MNLLPLFVVVGRWPFYLLVWHMVNAPLLRFLLVFHCNQTIAFQNKLSKPSSSAMAAASNRRRQSPGRNDCNCRNPYSNPLSTEIVNFSPLQTESWYFSPSYIRCSVVYFHFSFYVVPTSATTRSIHVSCVSVWNIVVGQRAKFALCWMHSNTHHTLAVMHSRCQAKMLYKSV